MITTLIGKKASQFTEEIDYSAFLPVKIENLRTNR